MLCMTLPMCSCPEKSSRATCSDLDIIDTIYTFNITEDFEYLVNKILVEGITLKFKSLENHAKLVGIKGSVVDRVYCYCFGSGL